MNNRATISVYAGWFLLGLLATGPVHGVAPAPPPELLVNDLVWSVGSGRYRFDVKP